MKNFVISLTSASDRRQHIANEFDKQDISFEFFDAITPPLPKLQALAQKFNVKIDNCDLTEPELACFFSHVCLWQKAVDEQLDYIAIFEDDIYLSSDAHYFLKSSDWIPENFDFIKIEKVYDKIITNNPKIKTIHQHYFIKLQSEHMGTGGYIMSIKMAKYALQYIQNLKADHVDQILFKDIMQTNTISIYQLNPVLCIQDCILYPDSQKFSSYLRWRDTLEKQPKIELSLTQKVIRELFRPFKQLYYLMNTIQIEFKG